MTHHSTQQEPLHCIADSASENMSIFGEVRTMDLLTASFILGKQFAALGKSIVIRRLRHWEEGKY